MPLNILYVEDNKINAVVMDKMLSQDNTQLIIAENGKDALEIAQKKKLDLVLMDINLGKNQMDGCEVLKQLKKLKNTHKTPVFAVTAYAMPDDKDRFINIGFDEYFSKPVDFMQLRSAIAKLKF